MYFHIFIELMLRPSQAVGTGAYSRHLVYRILSGNEFSGKHSIV